MDCSLKSQPMWTRSHTKQRTWQHRFDWILKFWILSACTCKLFKHMQTHKHLTRYFPQCKARHWAQRHTGTSSRIPPLLAAVHQHTHGSQPRTWCPCLTVCNAPSLLWVFVQQYKCGRRNEGWYTIWGAVVINEMTLQVGMMTFSRKVWQDRRKHWEGQADSDTLILLVT